MKQVLGFLGWMVLFAFVLVGTSPVSAESDCDAEVSVELAREDPDGDIKRFQFKVDISTSEGCAQIEYDLILEILLPNGQVKKVRKPRVVKLNDSALTELVEHELPTGESVADYEAKLVECTKCQPGA